MTETAFQSHLLVYTTRLGERLRGNTHEEVVDQMQQRTRFIPEMTRGEYMRSMARVATKQTGGNIRFDTAANFLADMQMVGLVEKNG